MPRNDSIKSLLKHNADEYIAIYHMVEIALKSRNNDPELAIKIKSFLENTRSALDYLAKDIANKYSLTSKKVYFPIVDRNSGENDYKSYIAKHLTDLKSKDELLYNYLEEIQPYHNKYAWLSDLINTTNKLKHDELTPIIQEETEIIISRHHSGSCVRWEPKSVRFGGGTYINGSEIETTTQLPAPKLGVEVKKMIWVDFQFTNGPRILPLLDKINDDIPSIIKYIYDFF